MRRAAKVDDNQADIVRTFRSLGCTVMPLHTVGRGCPDLLVGISGETHLVEVKDGSKPPSARRLTPDQVSFHEGWKGHPIHIVNNIGEAISLAKFVRSKMGAGIPFRGSVS